jgi:release factor glutamine methyltransferase
MTIHQAILYGENLLRDSGVENPRWEAELLLLMAVNQDRSRIYANLMQEISYDQLNQYQSLIRKRANHYPLAYLEGKQEFYGRSFLVNESVLIPRPETEEIIRAVLSLKLPSKPLILDLGAGSGCISATFALEIADARLVALEISDEAIQILLKNISANVSVVRGSMFAAPFSANSFDVVVTNPPYVEDSQFRELPSETRWEPHLALVTNDLEKTYREILKQASHVLKPSGYLVFEIGYGQADRITAICSRQNGLNLLQKRKDRQDILRTFVLQKKT